MGSIWSSQNWISWTETSSTLILWVNISRYISKSVGFQYITRNVRRYISKILSDSGHSNAHITVLFEIYNRFKPYSCQCYQPNSPTACLIEEMVLWGCQGAGKYSRVSQIVLCLQSGDDSLKVTDPLERSDGLSAIHQIMSSTVLCWAIDMQLLRVTGTTFAHFQIHQRGLRAELDLDS